MNPHMESCDIMTTSVTPSQFKSVKIGCWTDDWGNLVCAIIRSLFPEDNQAIQSSTATNIGHAAAIIGFVDEDANIIWLVGCFWWSNFWIGKSIRSNRAHVVPPPNTVEDEEE